MPLQVATVTEWPYQYVSKVGGWMFLNEHIFSHIFKGHKPIDTIHLWICCLKLNYTHIFHIHTLPKQSVVYSIPLKLEQFIKERRVDKSILYFRLIRLLVSGLIDVLSYCVHQPASAVSYLHKTIFPGDPYYHIIYTICQVTFRPLFTPYIAVCAYTYSEIIHITTNFFDSGW